MTTRRPTRRIDFESQFKLLAAIPLSQLAHLSRFDLGSLLPRKSVQVLWNGHRDVYATSEPRLLVIIAHLYLDYFLGRLLKEEGITLTRRERESFSAKIARLDGLGCADKDMITCLREVNQLRNNFAHDVFFDIANWDPREIPFVRDASQRVPQRRSLRRSLSVIIIRLTFMLLAYRMFEINGRATYGYMPSTPKSRQSAYLA